MASHAKDVSPPPPRWPAKKHLLLGRPETPVIFVDYPLGSGRHSSLGTAVKAGASPGQH